MVFQTSMLSGGSICHQYICAFSYMQNWCGVMVLHAPMVNWRRGCICHQYMCAFCYMWNIFGVMVLHAAMVSWGGSICLWYICIVLCAKLMWCNVLTCSYGRLTGEGGPSAFGICALSYVSDYAYGPLKVVPCCSNTVDCWWKHMSKLV